MEKTAEKIEEKPAESKHGIDMTCGSILPKILRFAAPLALSGILQLAFNAADVVVLGRFVGADALAAVGSTGSLVNLLINFFIALSVGVNVTVSTNYAAKRYNDVSRAVNTAVTIALAAGVFLIFAGVLLCKPMLTAMGSPEDILPMSVTYLRIYFCAMPFVLLYNFGSAILRSIGDTRRPFFFLLIAGVVNVCLNLFFVIVLGMGVAGVAIATDISNMISAVLVVIVLIREDSCLKLTKLGFDPRAVRMIARVGVPAGIQSVLFNVSNVIIQSSVNSFGAATMAANAAAANLEGFYSTAYSSVTDSVVTFISQNNGAKKYSRLNRIIWSTLICAFIICAICSAIYALFGRQLLSIYTTDPQVAEIGMRRLYVFICTYFLAAILNTMSGAIRGLGNGIFPMITVLVGAVGFRFFWIFVVFARYHDYQLLLWGYPISWAITSLVLIAGYIHERHKLPAEDAPENNIQSP